MRCVRDTPVPIRSSFRFKLSNSRRTAALPRRDCARRVLTRPALKAEGARNAGCLTHPQPRVRMKQAHELVTTDLPERPAFRAQWFERLAPRKPPVAGPELTTAPGDLPPRRPDRAERGGLCCCPMAQGRCAGISRLGPSAGGAVVSGAGWPVRRQQPRPVDPAAHRTPRAATASRPALVTIAIAPLAWDGMNRNINLHSKSVKTCRSPARHGGCPHDASRMPQLSGWPGQARP